MNVYVAEIDKMVGLLSAWVGLYLSVNSILVQHGRAWQVIRDKLFFERYYLYS